MGVREGVPVGLAEMCGGSAMSGGWIDEHVVGFGFAQCQVITPQFDLNWVAQGGCSDKRQLRSGQQSHLTKPNERGA